MNEELPNLDLRPDHLDIVRDILHRHVPDRKVLSFGSRATWTAKDYSDLDLAILGDEPLSLNVASALTESFEESDLPFKVDFVDWARTSENFRNVIEKEFVVLVEKEEQHELAQWRTVKLGAVADVSWGDTSTTKASYVKSGFTAYSAKGPDGFLPHADYNRVGVVLSAIGADCGRTWLAKGQWSCIKNTIRFWATDPKVNTEFLYWVTRNSSLWPKRGSAQPFISQGDARKLEISIPPLTEQRAIAHILGTLDDKIKLNRRMNETLEAMARALFKSWFVDFDPVRAKMEGRDTGLPRYITDLFPVRLVGSELGEIPEGWEVSTIGEEVTVVGGSTPSTKDRSLWGGKINWATPKDLSVLSAPVLLETARQITDAGLSKIGSGLLPQGVVLLSSRAPIGYLAIAEIPVAVNQGFIAMKCESRLSNMFAWLWAQANMDTILQNANGSTFQEISKRNFRPLKIMIPKIEILSTFDKRVRLLYERIVINQRESRTLAVLRDALLPELVSGKVRLYGTEIITEEVS